MLFTVIGALKFRELAAPKILGTCLKPVKQVFSLSFTLFKVTNSQWPVL